MVFIGAGNGQWVRARNERSAKLFLAEREMFRPKRERLPRTWQSWLFLVAVLVAFAVALLLSA